MASWTQQNAGSINANLNQEYVNWLQTQSLPNSKGPMGIKEAESILSNRPDLDHAYQQRFLEQKIGQMEGHFAAHGLPVSAQGVDKKFHQAQQNVAPVPAQSRSVVQSQAAEQGFGEAFKISSMAKNKAAEQISATDDQLLEQKNLLEKKAKARKDEATHK